VTDRPPRLTRSAPPEIAELRHLKRDHPELGPAVEMQIALVEMQRRIQARVPLPRLASAPVQARASQTAGAPIVRFADIPIDWTDFRLALRQTADILRRYDAIEADEHARLLALGRDPKGLEPLVAHWYAASSGVNGSSPATGVAGNLEQVFVLALRPFLARCVEALTDEPASADTPRRRCPVCGWEPDFAVITREAERRLVCGRCLAQWGFPQLACPFCGNDDRSRITSFATPDGQYRVTGCDVCHRYLKAYDARHASRPVLVPADTIATLPLDAAAMQRGYTS
jgi:FdhE protein